MSSSSMTWADLVKDWIQLGQCIQAAAKIVKEPIPVQDESMDTEITYSMPTLTVKKSQPVARSTPTFNSFFDRFVRRPKSPIRLPKQFLNRTVLTVAGKRVPFTRCMAKVARSQIKPLPTIVEMNARH
ncbi:hypothetical protein THRCLA_20623 [Thraustotheca clavata]|uniref:Uncharacterized protein n=1 Tax=Thraustotheca clavata TaxID=74557 RepID=A0A1W0A557_9STRA|nr:hypothetical protein THRCLA_20623 [Thraustotheca clavata]